MIPNRRDFADFLAQWKWLVGLGPRPRFPHFGYMEKFEYWAVYWGVITLGVTGLLLWFPVTFGRVFPGWIFNGAKIIHGEEALLAVLYVFAIHYFHVHFRPLRFPMDTALFTGREPLARAVEERALDGDSATEREDGRPSPGDFGLVFEAPSLGRRLAAWVFGGISLILGLGLLAGTVAGLLT